MAQKYPTNQPHPPHRDKDLEFDVFHIEGDVSHLPGQHFAHQAKEKTIAPQGPASPRHIADQSDGPVLKKMIHDARASQQEALKKTRAIQESPVINRVMMDAAGPQHERAILDARSPDHLRVITDGAGPVQQRILPGSAWPAGATNELNSAALVDLVAKTQHAQKIALTQMRSMKDAQGPSFIRISSDAIGPIRMRQSRDHQGPLLDPIRDPSSRAPSCQPDTAALSGPITNKNPEPGDLSERIRLARIAQEQALNLLKSMQDAQGPSDTAEMIDVSLRIARAREAQIIAMARLRAMSDFAGSTDARDTTNADGPVKPRSLSDSAGEADARQMTDVVGSEKKVTVATSGPADPRQTDSASGPAIAKHVSDNHRAGISQTMLDAAGPADPRGLADAEGPAIQKEYKDAEGPSDQRVIKDSIGPMFLRAIKDAFMPKRKSPKIETSNKVFQQPSTIAERIRKVRADQLKALEMLDDKSKK